MDEGWLGNTHVPDLDPGYLLYPHSTKSQAQNQFPEAQALILNFEPSLHQPEETWDAIQIWFKRGSTMFTWPEAIALSTSSLTISTEVWGIKAKPKSISLVEKHSFVPALICSERIDWLLDLILTV